MCSFFEHNIRLFACATKRTLATGKRPKVLVLVECDGSGGVQSDF